MLGYRERGMEEMAVIKTIKACYTTDYEKS
jgi:hypothetical protein